MSFKAKTRFNLTWGFELGSEIKQVIHHSQAGLMRKMPNRAMSRAFGKFCEVHFPAWIRTPCIRFTAWYYSCNVCEAKEEDLTKYETFGAFFKRELKPNLRPIDQASSLVSSLLLQLLHPIFIVNSGNRRLGECI